MRPGNKIIDVEQDPALRSKCGRQLLTNPSLVGIYPPITYKYVAFDLYPVPPDWAVSSQLAPPKMLNQHNHTIEPKRLPSETTPHQWRLLTISLTSVRYSHRQNASRVSAVKSNPRFPTLTAPNSRNDSQTLPGISRSFGRVVLFSRRLSDEQYRVQSALHSAFSATEEGWMPGGGVTLSNAAILVPLLLPLPGCACFFNF